MHTSAGSGYSIKNVRSRTSPRIRVVNILEIICSSGRIGKRNSAHFPAIAKLPSARVLEYDTFKGCALLERVKIHTSVSVSLADSPLINKKSLL